MGLYLLWVASKGGKENWEVVADFESFVVLAREVEDMTILRLEKKRNLVTVVSEEKFLRQRDVVVWETIFAYFPLTAPALGPPKHIRKFIIQAAMGEGFRTLDFLQGFLFQPYCRQCPKFLKT